MHRHFYFVTALAVMLLFVSCGDQGGNTTDKPANAANNAAAKPADMAAVEAEVKKMVNDTAALLAKNDVAALEKLYHDNYMLVNLDGSVQNRADRLASFKSGETKFESFAYDEVNIRVNPEGTGAIVIARAMAKGVNKGKPIGEAAVRVTQVWRKTPEGWKQVTGHATTITGAPDAKPANTNTTGSAPANNK